MDKPRIYKIAILPILILLLVVLVFLTTPNVESSNEADEAQFLYSLNVDYTEIDAQNEADTNFSPEIEDIEMQIKIETDGHDKNYDVPQTEPKDSEQQEETIVVVPEETISEDETLVSEEEESSETEETTKNETIIEPPTETDNVSEENTTTDLTPSDEETATEETKDETTEDVQEEIIIEKFIPIGSYARPDFTIYNDDEKALLELVLNKIEENKNTDIKEETIDVPFDMDINSYYKVASYFYVYYGQKRAVDETFDLINYHDYNTNTRKMQLRMRYNDIRQFEADMDAVRTKADEVLMSFSNGTEEEILMQIAEYLRNNITYTDNNYDLHNALINGKSVCNGYALAFNLLANRAGIKSDMCIGEIPAGYHAWNRVTLSDGSQYFYDITFFDGNKPNYKYVHSTTQLHTDNYLINDYTSCWFAK